MISQGASKVIYLILFKAIHKSYLCILVLHINTQLVSDAQVNISLIVNDSEAEQCVRALHKTFFESDLSELVWENGHVTPLSTLST